VIWNYRLYVDKFKKAFTSLKELSNLLLHNLHQLSNQDLLIQKSCRKSGRVSGSTDSSCEQLWSYCALCVCM